MENKYILTINDEHYIYDNLLDLKYSLSYLMGDINHKIYYSLLENREYNANGNILSLKTINNNIKFCLNYNKLHNQTKAKLLDVSIVESELLDKEYLNYDTISDIGTFYIKKGKYILLTFLGNKNIPFTTLREYSDTDFAYYTKLIHCYFNIVIAKSKYLCVSDLNIIGNYIYNDINISVNTNNILVSINNTNFDIKNNVTKSLLIIMDYNNKHNINLIDIEDINKYPYMVILKNIIGR